MILFSLVIIVNYGCQLKQKNNNVKLKVIEKKESIKKNALIEDKLVHLNDKNAIPFLFNYSKENKEDKVRIITKFGNIEIKLFKNYNALQFIN